VKTLLARIQKVFWFFFSKKNFFLAYDYGDPGWRELCILSRQLSVIWYRA